MRSLTISKSITTRESLSLDKYLNDVSKLTMVTPEEETILAREIREGNAAAYEKLITANLRFVVSVAKQYQNQGLSLPDLINEGNIGLMKAARRFDETRGFKFISYAVWWIRQAVTQAISEQSRIIRLPLNKVSTMNKIRKMQGILEQKMERQPTMEELAQVLPDSLEEIERTLAASVKHTSLDMTIGDQEQRLCDFLADSEIPSPDSDLIAHARNNDVRRILAKLDSREREILVLCYGIGQKQPCTLDEIAEKLNLSRERVRQLREQAMRNLRKISIRSDLRNYL